MSEIVKIQRELTGKTVTREFFLKKEEIDNEARTVPLAFSSEAPVSRWWGGREVNEVLDHSPESCDLARLKTGGPLLMDHNPSDQVGVVDSCEIMQDRKGRAVVRFSRSARGEEIFQDVKDGIRSLVSVGYEVRKVELTKKDGEVETCRVTSWSPLEISLVSIPADTSVGVGRNKSTQEAQQMKQNTHLLDAAPATDTRGGGGPAAPAAPAPNVTEVRNEAIRLERERVNTIREIQKQAGDRVQGASELADEAVAKGTSPDEYQRALFQRFTNAKPLNEAEADPNIGMSRKELRRWSIVKAIREASLEGGITGLEKEASEAVAKKIGKRASGFFVPHDVAELSFAEARDLNSVQAELIAMQIRALSAGSNTAGGFTVGTNLATGSIVELLRNKTVINRLGARTLSGLVGNIAIPKITGGATAYWLPEVGTVTASDQSFGQLVLAPNRLSADTLFSKELVMQSSIDIEGLIRNDLTTVMAIEKDRAALHGTGANGEPTGIFNTTGLATSVTFGGAATWAKILEFETNLATANADMGAIAFVTSPAARGKWKGIARFSSTDTPLWKDDNTVNGYPALATNQIAGNLAVFGNWNDLIVAEWAGIDIVTDPFTAKKTGQIEVTMTLWTDIGVRQPKSFVISADTAAA